MALQDIADRVALVTGASTGIGAGIVHRLLESGVRVHGISRRADALERLDPAAVREGRFVPHALDVADTARVRALAAELAVTDPIDTLVCAAGTNVPARRFAELTDESFGEIMATNVTGVFAVLSATLPQLRAAAGDVVIISSVAAAWPDHSGAAYGASKSALLGLARGASRDEHGNGVRFCTILPGIVDTPILDKRPSPPPREVRDWAIHPDDIAEAVHTAIALPPRTNIAELTVVATRLQSLGNTQQATPSLPAALTIEEVAS
ncbi:SDR family NAD(P)-dependent oxidoreductase [Pseudoclavibacter chungangensis]|uniref:SDR family NAD(P)-dependent oxidoreductase n=1 Tax=Pseudoclavibacter chungangensis TaxID=587635 RepID=A0A7J5BR83_9MICO|nr:SDR family NAD(P)-dependent oxidoreductase [Pseudoclavibacter chungangensis]KAB1656027.1 SDR family NAD(P)-dependent oxidoreductase [Pseudoclavibacter chungangensis]NYJ66485.1 NADP-dependent 3-hydroxy acid dehydrogenase YdfG [Pseudoclavibacter chungangensis]